MSIIRKRLNRGTRFKRFLKKREEEAGSDGLENVCVNLAL